MSSAARRRDGSGRRWRMSKRKRQEAILSIIAKHQVATQEELVERLHRAGILTTQATVSRDIAELGLMRVAGDDPLFVALTLQSRAYSGLAQRLALLGAYVQPED